MGQKNLSVMQMLNLLDIVEEVEPLGANTWEECHIIYEEWAVKEGYPVHDGE